jgi:hypothetical protein
MANAWKGSSASFGGSRIYEIQDATYAVSPNDSGTVFLLNSALDIAVSLPAISKLEPGFNVKFVLKSVVASAKNFTITQGHADDELVGHVRDGSADGTGDVADAASNTKVQFTATAPAGSFIDMICDDTSWYCFGAESTTAKLTFED